MYSYCGNNPACFKDNSGEAFETVFDIISLAASVADVIANPTNPWAWAGLLGDIIDVAVPFLTGVGETVKAVGAAVRVIDNADDIVDAAKTVRRMADVGDDVKDTVGTYLVLFNDGRNYAGKGPFSHAIKSAQSHADAGGGVSALVWAPAASDRQAFIAEYLLQSVWEVGRESPKTFNIIWSPGRLMDRFYR